MCPSSMKVQSQYNEQPSTSQVSITDGKGEERGVGWADSQGFKKVAIGICMQKP
jgi:hypothetical protein